MSEDSSRILAINALSDLHVQGQNLKNKREHGHVTAGFKRTFCLTGLLQHGKVVTFYFHFSVLEKFYSVNIMTQKL